MKLNKAENDKRLYNTYKAGYAAFTAECAEQNARTLPPDRIGALEQQCKKVLKKARMLLRRLPKDDIKRSIERDCEALYEHLDTIRRAYIAGINTQHGCALNADELLALPKFKLQKLNIQDVVFQKLVRDLIPAHPKDEFPLARRMKRHFVIHSGTTNTGKTYNALIALKEAETGVYLAPLRLLALQVFQLLNEDGVACTLSTGEEEIITPGAKHISSTIEKLDTDKEYDVAVIDEAQ
ncbi:MAG: hypothetical protein FWE49_06135, partial [Synergistaceae bacterium]|nr:hypothetical protein [Synergistaceae bacterium]